jgi:hypothetical protein
VSESQDRPFGQRLKRGFESKILVPVASAIVSAAASYLIKKLPLILEEKVLPKLTEKDAPQPVVTALEQAASTLGDGGGSTAEPADEKEAPTADAERPMSNDERAEERRKREQRRRQRKSTSAKAA